MTFSTSASSAWLAYAGCCLMGFERQLVGLQGTWGACVISTSHCRENGGNMEHSGLYTRKTPLSPRSRPLDLVNLSSNLGLLGFASASVLYLLAVQRSGISWTTRTAFGLFTVATAAVSVA